MTSEAAELREAGDLLQIQLLGGFELALGDRPVGLQDQSRLQSLLAYLLLHREQPVPRRQLAFAFWPGSSDSGARNNLRALLHRLRASLPAADAFLEYDRHTIQWRPDSPFRLDVATFETSLAAAQEAELAGRNGKSAVELLRQAVDAYGGDLLPDCYDDWILPERERLRQAFGRALEQLVASLEETRDYRGAIRYAQRLVRHDPLRETAYRYLMRLHLARGDRATALRVYHTCATILRHELGVDPGPATLETYERVLSADVAPEVAHRPEGPVAAVPPLVGRERPWQMLMAAWRRASSGQAGLLLLTGEPGIGKTRLAEELVAWVDRQGSTTSTARCYATAGSLAYAPVAEWLRDDRVRAGLDTLDPERLVEVARLAPDLLGGRPQLPAPGPLTEAWQRQRFFGALARAFAGPGRPLLLLIDDLQWCDPETIDWLHYLLQTERQARLLVLGTVRLEEVANDHPLTALRLALQRRAQIREIALDPLSQVEAAALAGHVAGRDLAPQEVARLLRESEGNPLFVVEMMRAGLGLAEDASGEGQQAVGHAGQLLPPKALAAVRHRLAELSPQAGAVAQGAAVIGREFQVGVLQRVVTLDEDALVRALDELWQRKIVREQGIDAYDFSHGKLRDVAYQDMGMAQRRLLHGRVAEALADRHAAALDAASGQIALHFELAGRRDPAIAFYRRAAAAAQAVYANEAALAYHGRLLSLLPESQRGETLLAMGRLWQRTGAWDLAEDAYRRALDQAQAQSSLRARCLYAWGDLLYRHGRYADALAVLEDAQQGFVALEDWQGRADVLLTLGRIHWRRASYSRATACFRQLLQMAKGQGDPVRTGQALQGIGNVHWHQGDYAQALEMLGQALEASEQGQDPATEASLLGAVGTMHWHLGDSGQAFACFQQQLEAARRIGHHQELGRAVGNLGLLYQTLGAADVALACYRHKLADAVQVGDRVDAAVMLANMADAYLALERPDDAEPLCALALALARDLHLPYYQAAFAHYQARLRLQQGRLREALEANEEALRVSSQAQEGFTRLPALLLEVQLRQRAGQITTAAAVAELEALLPAAGEPRQRMAVHLALWQLDASRTRDRDLAAALCRDLYARTPEADLRASYRSLTGEELPPAEPLPEPPAIIAQPTLSMDQLLAEARDLIAHA